MPTTSLTLVYSPQEESLARSLAASLQSSGYTFSTLDTADALLVVLSADALTDASVLNTVKEAQRLGVPAVAVSKAPLTLPAELSHLKPIVLKQGGVIVPVLDALRQLPARNRDVQVLKRNNQRLLLWFGVGMVLLFGFYTWAIAVFDIEAPVEDFERAYTRSAATVGAFAQPFVPQTTEQAENFEITLESRQISAELATVIVQTATQAHLDGGFTPIPTGFIIMTEELSVVRQTATGGAIIRATATAQGEDAQFEALAATATQAAVDANATLSVEIPPSATP